MFKGKYIDTYLTCEEGTKAVHIVVNIPAANFGPDVFSKFSTLIEDVGLKKKHYEEERIDGDIFKVELIALLDAGKGAETKKRIEGFLEKELELNKENIYVSDISDKLIIDSSPYLMTENQTNKRVVLMPIYSKNHFIRSLNDFILEFRFDTIINFTRYYYTHGLVYLGQEYLDKCQELSMEPKQIEEDGNKRIIRDIFRSTYSAEISNIVTREIEGKTLIKIQVKDNFFLYHPTCESRLDVHNGLLSPVIALNVRNCAFMREIFAGFFERIYYGSIHDLTKTAQIEDKKYYGFEFDYIDDNNYIFDFENPKWKPVSIKSEDDKISLRKFREKARANPDVRIECCKAVNLMKRYKIFIDKSTRKIVPLDKVDSNDSNILPLDYLSFTLNRIGNKVLTDVLSFKIGDQLYNWHAEVNKIFYDFFFSENSDNPTNSEYVKREKDPDDDYCTFYFYDEAFIIF